MSYKKYESAKVTNVTTPSVYGSHKSMVVGEEDGWVICKDDRGQYKTKVENLDNGLADPYRNNGERII